MAAISATRSTRTSIFHHRFNALSEIDEIILVLKVNLGPLTVYILNASVHLHFIYTFSWIEFAPLKIFAKGLNESAARMPPSTRSDSILVNG